MATRSRYARNGHRRRQIKARLMAQGATHCAICGDPLDFSLKCPHPRSVEVDEIIPCKLGGDELDINNCQLVHRICNEQKGRKLHFVKHGVNDTSFKQRPAKRPKASQNWDN